MSVKNAPKPKRGRPAVKGPAILFALKAHPGATVVELGTTIPMLNSLEAKGLVTKSGQRLSGKRGRPAAEFKLTLQGYNRIRSLSAANHPASLA